MKKEICRNIWNTDGKRNLKLIRNIILTSKEISETYTCDGTSYISNIQNIIDINYTYYLGNNKYGRSGDTTVIAYINEKDSINIYSDNRSLFNGSIVFFIQVIMSTQQSEFIEVKHFYIIMIKQLLSVIFSVRFLI